MPRISYYLVMGNASNKVLCNLVGNVFARQVMTTGKELNATQRAVMVRLQNAVAIEESCAVLRAAEAHVSYLNGGK